MFLPVLLALASSLLLPLQRRAHFRRHSLSSRRPRHSHMMRLPALNFLYEFHLPLQLNGISYQLLLDTGSSELVAKGEGRCGGLPQKRLDCSSCEQFGNSELYYLDGGIQVSEFAVDVTVGNVTVKGNAQLMTDCDQIFESLEGIVGLYYEPKKTNFIHMLLEAGVIQQPLLAIALRNHQDSNFIALGEVPVDLLKTPNSLQTLQLLDGLHYEIKIDGGSVDGQAAAFNQAVVLDSGNSCLMLNRQLTNLFLQRLSALGLDRKCVFQVQDTPQFSCLYCYGVTKKEVLSLPSIEFSAGGRTVISLGPSNYVQKCMKTGNNKYDCDMLIEAGETFDEVTFGLPLWDKYLGVLNFEDRTFSLGEFKEGAKKLFR